MAARHNAGPVAASAEGLTVIGAGIHVNGRVSGEEDLRVEGRVEGSVNLSETLHIAAQGIVVAEVEARDVVVSGVVVGNVTATDSVTLNPGAKLVGDIAAPRIIIADGAAFRGNVAMGGEPPPRRERVRSAARPRAVAAPSRPKAAAAPAPRVAAVRPADSDEEVTVVVRHAALQTASGSGGSTDRTAGKKKSKKKGKKAPPRGRVPKPGKRRVNRRS